MSAISYEIQFVFFSLCLHRADVYRNVYDSGRMHCIDSVRIRSNESLSLSFACSHACNLADRFRSV